MAAHTNSRRQSGAPKRPAHRSGRASSTQRVRSGSARTSASAARSRRDETPPSRRRASSQTPVRGTATSSRATSKTSRRSAVAATRSPVSAARRRPVPTNKKTAHAPQGAKPSTRRVTSRRPRQRASNRRVGSPQRRLRLALVVIAVVMAAIVGRVAYLSFGLILKSQEFVGPGGQPQPAWSEGNAALTTDEQSVGQLVAQRSDVHRHRRFGDPELGCRRLDRPEPGNSGERCELCWSHDLSER